MPQAYVILGPRFKLHSMTYFNDVMQGIMQSTESILGVPVKNDVALTVVQAVHTVNEADIQVEIRYTAGKDEYHTGRVFDPSASQRELLAKEILRIMREFFGSRFKLSVWIKPYYKSLFVYRE